MIDEEIAGQETEIEKSKSLIGVDVYGYVYFEASAGGATNETGASFGRVLAEICAILRDMAIGGANFQRQESCARPRLVVPLEKIGSKLAKAEAKSATAEELKTMAGGKW